MSDRNQKQATSSVLDLLRKLTPPHTLIHVGAGSGTGPLHQWHNWEIPNVVLVDANKKRMAWAENKNTDTWNIIEAAIGETESEQTYYQASNPDEAGLIEPEALSNLWPNLKTAASGSTKLQTLDSIKITSVLDAANLWLFVDCMPALSILKGAVLCLEKCSVLCLRVLLNTHESLEVRAGLGAINSYLEPLGFNNVDLIEGSNPSVCHAIFSRNWQRILSNKINLVAAQNIMLSESIDVHKVSLDEAAQKITQHEKMVVESQAQNRQLHTERDEFASRVENYKKQLAVSEVSREQQAKLAEDRLAKINQLTKEREVALSSAKEAKSKLAGLEVKEVQQAKLVEESLAQINQLNEERDGAETSAKEAKKQLAELKINNLELIKLAADRLDQINDSNKSLAERAVLIKEMQEKLSQSSVVLAEKSKVSEFQKLKIDELNTILDDNKSINLEIQAKLDKQKLDYESLLEKVGLNDESKRELQSSLTRYKDKVSELEVAAIEAEKKRKEIMAEVAERDERQQMLNDEITRAEAQIDLIKDVVLREGGL